MTLNEAERQLLMATAYLPGRHARLLRWDMDTPTDREHLQTFGEYWFGRYLVPWEDAYQSLQAQNLLIETHGCYRLTPTGIKTLKSLTHQTPIYWYEYNLYYTRAQNSLAHHRFCQQVYGEDLQQHGLTDVAQMNVLLKELALSPDAHVLDAGCGSGRITDWLQRHSGAYFWGIDMSDEGIKSAHQLAHAKLKFSVDHMEHLSLPINTFDAIVAVDTIYYMEDLNAMLAQFLNVLKPQGQMGIFCHNWIWQAADRESLKPDGNDLALALQQAKLPYRWVDLTKAGRQHWLKKLAVLETMKDEFVQEGNEALYTHRFDEAYRYANWPVGWDNRYLYVVQV